MWASQERRSQRGPSPEAQPGGRGPRAAPLLLERRRRRRCSQPVEESEERVWRAVAAGFAVQWPGAGECLFFDRKHEAYRTLAVTFNRFAQTYMRPRPFDWDGVDPAVLTDALRRPGYTS